MNSYRYMNGRREWIRYDNGIECPYYDEFGDELLWFNLDMMQPFYSGIHKQAYLKQSRASPLGLLSLLFVPLALCI